MIEIRNILKGDGGSAAIFICIILTSVLITTAAFFYAAELSSARSENDARLRLASRSVLSEYDRELFKRYGLLAFKADEKEMEDSLRYFCENLDSGLQIRDDILDFDANTKGYHVSDVNIFEKQIEDACLNSFVEAKLGKYKKLKGQVSSAIRDRENTRVLRRSSIIKALPSKGFDTSILPALDIKLPGGNLNEQIDAVKSKLLIDEYILSTFKYAVGGQTEEETFFENEVEYILHGSKDDKANYEAIRNTLWGYRFAMNNVHVLTDKKKMEIITNWAKAHPLVALATAVIVEIWVACETNNDILLLERGEKVAPIKKADNWALDDLESIMESFGIGDVGEDGELIGDVDKAYTNDAISPKNGSGIDYAGHLRAYLLLTDHNIKLLRMMDLIQINMKGRYDRDFTLNEYATGFELSANTKRETYEFASKY